MVRKTREEAEQTRVAVLNSALDLFYEKGFARTTFDEIAKRIDLTKGAVYWHFRNKADLLVALIKQMIYDTHSANGQEFIFFDNNKSIQNIAGLKQNFIDEVKLVESNSRYRKFLFFIIFQMEWSEAMISRVRNDILCFQDFPLQQIKQTLTFAQKSGDIAPEVDINLASTIFFCMWRGTLSSYISKEKEFNLLEVVSKSFDIIVDGFTKEKPKCK